MISIFVNGSSMQIAQDTTLTQLIEQLELSGKRIAIEQNEQIISATKHHTTTLKIGDSIEIIHAVGGG